MVCVKSAGKPNLFPVDKLDKMGTFLTTVSCMVSNLISRFITNTRVGICEKESGPLGILARDTCTQLVPVLLDLVVFSSTVGRMRHNDNTPKLTGLESNDKASGCGFNDRKSFSCTKTGFPSSVRAMGWSLETPHSKPRWPWAVA